MMDRRSIAEVLLQYRHADGLDNAELEGRPIDLQIRRMYGSLTHYNGKQRAPFSIYPFQLPLYNYTNSINWTMIYERATERRETQSKEAESEVDRKPSYFSQPIVSLSWLPNHNATVPKYSPRELEVNNSTLTINNIIFNCSISTYDMNKNGFLQFSSTYDADQLAGKSLEIMVLDINTVNNYPLLIRNLFNYETHVHRSIIIIGPCSIKFDLEVHLDLFIQQNRVWRYNASSPNVCDYDQYSRETGILAILKKDPYLSKQRHLSRLDNLQFSTSVWKQTFQGMPNGSCDTVDGANGEIPGHGMFSSLHFVTDHLHAFSNNNDMTVEKTEYFPYADQWNDYLLPLASCSLDDIRLNNIQRNRYPRGSNFNGEPIDPTDWKQIVDRSIEMDFIVRPNYLTRYLVHMFKKDLWKTQRSSECVAIHVRNGDKVQEDKVYTLDSFLSFFSHQYNVPFNLTNYNNIFLMTNNNTLSNPEYLAENYPEFNFNVMKEPVLIDDSKTNADELKFHPGKDRFMVGANLLVQTILASQCKYFLGTLSSNLGRAVIELMVGSENLVNDAKWASIDGSKYIFFP
ncbi:hypothetical protein SAMD00019534_035270 [Acytostelium subglobosum LB1]|uniref:hypothetical protein n=1 Tax=Acytostelium subglobosum LB1 TaxID=1410327 RepID=UPI000644B127|nr:hypothetical protein SAMD00019534_035270 [Acytostelium subglobosum LB1]GAM20352.1 hypothetical protein SAMD00019534_035270 [Acytostelium subglobosum LB1]|eukprot:XP_012759873.1 hypothetical protein SAMD00019534_035270 [Acytostelium subglobosum LB1]